VTLTATSCALFATELNSKPTLWVKRSVRLRVEHMPQYIGLVSLLIRDYDEAIAFYTTVLGFKLTEDKQYLSKKSDGSLSHPQAQPKRAFLWHRQQGQGNFRSSATKLEVGCSFS
jgi:hypothetical protein